MVCYNNDVVTQRQQKSSQNELEQRWRSRLVGRGRMIGNHVNRKRFREFESLLLRQKKDTPLGVSFFALLCFSIIGYSGRKCKYTSSRKPFAEFSPGIMTPPSPPVLWDLPPSVPGWPVRSRSRSCTRNSPRAPLPSDRQNHSGSTWRRCPPPTVKSGSRWT